MRGIEVHHRSVARHELVVVVGRRQVTRPIGQHRHLPGTVEHHAHPAA
jgi:hypothetical protein